jgi:NAD-dependent deacetylase
MTKRKHIVILTGAGISAESGLKTFRDSDGLWNGYNIEDVATLSGWRKNAEMVLDFYNMRRKDVQAAQPNAAHYGLAALEEKYDVTIITQNIDDLHERAGSTNIIHLHGQILEMRSEKNEHLVYRIEHDIKIGDKAEDGAQLRPNVVWFGEAVPAIEDAASITELADAFVVIGTSLLVYPAAGLLDVSPSFCPKFIVDKHIPFTTGVQNVTNIELPATEGVKVLTQKLHELFG